MIHVLSRRHPLIPRHELHLSTNRYLDRRSNATVELLQTIREFLRSGCQQFHDQPIAFRASTDPIVIEASSPGIQRSCG